MIQPDSCQDTADDPLASPEVIVFPVAVDVSNSKPIGEALLGAFRPGVSVVVADLGATEFCDSTGIRHLILANNQAARAGVDFRVVISSPAVLRVLHVLEVDQLLRMYPDMASALTGPRTGGDGP